MSIMITEAEFRTAVKGCDGVPSGKYNAFINSVNYAGISSKRECAMYLANLLHESGGLRYKVEINKTVPVYYGRGYIQLTHNYNYEACSNAIYGDKTVLLNNPDMIIETEEMCFKTAGWYWRDRVLDTSNFDATIKAINPVCDTPEQSERRRKYFRICLNAFNA